MIINRIISVLTSVVLLGSNVQLILNASETDCDMVSSEITENYENFICDDDLFSTRTDYFSIQPDLQSKPGDINGDSEVNLKDSILLSRYLAGGWNIKINELSADLNGDRKVNLADAILFKRYLAGGWDVQFDKELKTILSLGKANIDNSAGKLYIPINISSDEYLVKNISLKLKFDPVLFSISHLNEGDISGKWSWYTICGETNAEFKPYIKSRYECTVFVAEYNINESISEGYYEFSISDLEITVTDDSGEEKNITFEECSRYDKTIRVYIGDSESAPGETDPPEITLPENPIFEVSEIYDAMIALKKDYPEGMEWTNDNYYAWRGGIYSAGYGCAGFAFLLSDAAFGNLPAKKIENTDGYSIRVGDILRVYNNSHSVIVLEVTESGVVLAEGNYNSSVHWGRTMSWSELKNALNFVLTRYPD